MNEQLTLGSLFDGSGGFPLGGLISGILPVWASEIEPFPIRVTTKRMPFMKHYGDVSALNGAELEPVDIITFGSPCQDMSVAGKRAGLDGSRSNLFYEAVRIAKEMRAATNGKYPTWLCWENVPGAFSSNGGADFKAVLDEIRHIKDPEADTPRPERWPNAGCVLADDYSVAWRVFDAQYWGVPQRRKRIYLVADLAGQRAGKVLFESEGLSGYTPESFRSWQGTAGSAEEGPGEAGRLCLNDQGGERMCVSEDVTGTLRAQDHGHPPVVMGSAGFCTEHSAKARSIGYEEETSPTLRAGTVPATVYENHGQDTRFTGPVDTAPTIVSSYGTGGNNQPFVVETPKTLKIRCGCEGGGKGALIQDDKSDTLGCNNDQTLFVPFAKGTRPHSSEEGQQWKESDVANTLTTYDVGEVRCNELAVKVFGICSKDSNAMKSDNPHSGFYEARTTRTLDGNGGNPVCNQGGMAVVAIEGNGSRPSHQGRGYSEEDVSFTLNATEQHGVAHPVYCTSKSSFHMTAEEDLVNTLVASDYKDPPIVIEDPYYVVRRLTPTECARLQGFPDWWCSGLETEEPTESDLEFWREVFETHRKVTGTGKPKNDPQIIRWLKDPHSDSAEYKLWGNGVALPCVCFVLAGIVYCARNEA